MQKRKTTRKWREIVRRRKDLKAAQRRKQQFRRRDRRRQAFATMKWRLKAVRDYRARRTTCKEHVAAKQAASRFGVSVPTIRRWEKNYRDNGKRGLLLKVSDKGGRKPILSFEIVSFIVLLRTRFGWGAILLAAEIANKGIAQISPKTVHRIFGKYHLPTQTYHPKGKSNGIRYVLSLVLVNAPINRGRDEANGQTYRRYRRRAPNELWHVDFAGPFPIADQKVYLLVVVDDYSRFALAIEAIESRETAEVQAILEEYKLCNTVRHGRFFKITAQLSHRYGRRGRISFHSVTRMM